MIYPSIENLNLSQKKVLIRVDFNVPQNSLGQIVDDTRLRAAQKTIQFVLKKGGAVILISHLGRPKGERKMNLTLQGVVQRLQELLNLPVQFLEDCVGDQVRRAKHHLKVNQILLCENLRFHAAEEKPAKNPHFAKELAEGVDCYINEAFSCSHREHSSITEVPKYIQNVAFGYEHLREIQAYERYLKEPQRPFAALIGGAKVSSKINTLKALLDKVDVLLIAGAMAHTFFSAQNYPVGQSLYEPELVDEALKIMHLAKEKQVPLLLPLDIAIKTSEQNKLQVHDIDQIPSQGIGVDIGPKTLEKFESILLKAKTIFWNGPVGVFEKEISAKGTLQLAHFLAKAQGVTFVGGGDSTAALHQAGVFQKMTFVSTGGGASLELIEFGSLPGIDVLINKKFM